MHFVLGGWLGVVNLLAADLPLVGPRPQGIHFLWDVPAEPRIARPHLHEVARVRRAVQVRCPTVENCPIVDEQHVSLLQGDSDLVLPRGVFDNAEGKPLLLSQLGDVQLSQIGLGTQSTGIGAE